MLTLCQIMPHSSPITLHLIMEDGNLHYGLGPMLQERLLPWALHWQRWWPNIKSDIDQNQKQIPAFYNWISHIISCCSYCPVLCHPCSCCRPLLFLLFPCYPSSLKQIFLPLCCHSAKPSSHMELTYPISFV